MEIFSKEPSTIKKQWKVVVCWRVAFHGRTGSGLPESCRAEIAMSRPVVSLYLPIETQSSEPGQVCPEKIDAKIE